MIKEDTVYSQCKNNQFHIHRVKWIMWPLAFNALCLLSTMLSWEPNCQVGFILAFVYFMGLGAPNKPRIQALNFRDD